MDYYPVDKGKQTSNPGPIDNTVLFQGKSMDFLCIAFTGCVKTFYFCIIHVHLCINAIIPHIKHKYLSLCTSVIPLLSKCLVVEITDT